VEEKPAESLVSEGRPSEEPSLLLRVERHIWRRVLAGLLLLVPVLVTFVILRVVFIYVDSIYRGENGFLNFLLRDKPWNVPGIGVILSLGLLYVIGAFFSGKRSQALQDAVLTRVPLVRNIYGVARQVTEAIYSEDGHHYSRVVYVEWPRHGVVALGFVTGSFDRTSRGLPPLVAVYIPTVPNPTSGMLAFFSVDDIMETDIPVQDAMKTVFSGGLVLPKTPPHPGLQTSTQIDEQLDR
jgi:uncharacterized membrane protein